MPMEYPRIAQVVPESIAAELGVKAGFALVAVNGQAVVDILDYRWALASERLTLTLLDIAKDVWEVEIEKDYGEDIGLVFEHPTIAPLYKCKNNCLFCFVAQLPPGVRHTLCIKDDDYRLSSLHGSFITLTNLSDADWQRLLTMRPSPLYVSVHTTNGSLRQKMMRNPRAGTILEQLQILAAHHIEIHCQVVLVPDLNDGAELDRTITDLLALWPAVQSVAIVPVGLTAHRDHLTTLRRATTQDARQVIDKLLPVAQRAKRDLGVSFVYLADEFFLLAQRQVPERTYYDDFPQIENGIGLTRLMLDELEPCLQRLPRRLATERHVIWVTGHLIAPVLQEMAWELNQVEGLWVDVLSVPNNFFGQSVTVTGLLTGQDILAALQGIATDNAYILVPEVALREQEQDFLDDMTLNELEQALPRAKVIVTPTDGEALIHRTLGEEV